MWKKKKLRRKRRYGHLLHREGRKTKSNYRLLHNGEKGNTSGSMPRGPLQGGNEPTGSENAARRGKAVSKGETKDRKTEKLGKG